MTRKDRFNIQDIFFLTFSSVKLKDVGVWQGMAPRWPWRSAKDWGVCQIKPALENDFDSWRLRGLVMCTRPVRRSTGQHLVMCLLCVYPQESSSSKTLCRHLSLLEWNIILETWKTHFKNVFRSFFLLFLFPLFSLSEGVNFSFFPVIFPSALLILFH